MSEPCSEKDNIKKLFEFHEKKMAQLADMEKRQIVIGGDIVHIRSRIDNGMSRTIDDMHRNLSLIVPVIDMHTRFQERLENFFWWTLKILIAALISTGGGMFVWNIVHGWTPKL